VTQPRVFTHVDAPLGEVYRRVMRAFVASKRRFVVHLRPEDVAEALRADGGESLPDEAVGRALASLEEWGNVRADPDTSRVTTLEDFYRPRYLYQLSREGEAAERALEVYEQEIGRRGELQAVALEDIRIRLRALRDLAGQGAPDAAVVHNLLLELAGRLDSLAANAGAFMGSLQRTIDLQDVEEEAFLAYKDRLIAYLERFVSELVVKAYDIAGTLGVIDADQVEALLRMAAEREASDVAPDAAGPSASTRPMGAAAEIKLAEWRRRWSGLRAWFVGDPRHPSQAALLRQRARQAIPDLLATIGLLQERRSGRTDRSADFRELARWFAQCPSDADAHRLWRAAFGLSTARHLTGLPPEGTTSAATRWQDAPPVTIAPRLRATGQYQRRGAPSRVADRSADRSRLAALVAAERAQTEAARVRLATGRPTRLGEIGRLDREEFALLLRLLGEALSAGPPGADGTIRTITSDGSVEITLTAQPDAGVVALHTLDGVLYAPEHEIVIVDRASTARLEARSGT
jgi:uncharacterized protein (TIGR02677 family)